MSVQPRGAAAWFERAEGDLLSARNNMKADQVPWANVLFSSHQAIEKFLKGLLVFHGSKVAKTHDLGALLHAVESYARLDHFKEQCNTVTAMYLVARYPETGEISELDAHSAFELAVKLREAVLSSIPSSER